MTVKFKIGFSVTAETLFGLMAKFLPVEDLHVEELVEPAPTLTRRAALTHDAAPKIRKRSVNAGGGQLKVITEFAHARGVVSYGEIRRALAEEGFAAAGAGSAIARAIKHGFLRKQGNGYASTKGSAH